MNFESLDHAAVPQDRHCLLQSASIVLTGVGAALLMKGALPYWSFFAGGAALFVGTIVLEGISMSLTSKACLRNRRNVPGDQGPG